ncbi:ATP-binding protein [Chitinophaga niabensis]|uniref:ATP-binding protein n=1 Tax=Chitinophaga niabensis TaxID=536979 RepID=UPI0031BB4D08
MLSKKEFEHLKKSRAERIPPSPDSLIETFRAIGYNLPTALADIVDNSISAGAGSVRLDFIWAEDKSYITIHDDGHGMIRDHLVEALRPGTHNPLGDRRPEDLGRFGLGLKTASFSQCRILTVITKEKEAGEIHYRSWNLDYVEYCNEWEILEYLSEPQLMKPLERQPSGTTVVWENLDRVVYDQENRLISEAKFYESVREVEQHLAMVFHRFLEGKKLKIWINNNAIIPWDPFLRDEKFTQAFPAESFSGDRIRVAGYVLPHQEKISVETWHNAAGANGWNAHQGFYIYRKDRMLVSGDWLQLFKKEEFTRLARIMIDIDSDLDFAWQLDIRKSRAIPPRMFRDELKRYGAAIRKAASEVYKHRGKQKQRKSGRSHFEFVWTTIEENGRDYFQINRNHPLIRALAEQLKPQQKELEKVLRLLEVTLPIPTIVLNESLNADNPHSPCISVNDSEVNELMQATYQRLLKEGYSKAQAREELYFIDPFSNYTHLLESLKD